MLRMFILMNITKEILIKELIWFFQIILKSPLKADLKEEPLLIPIRMVQALFGLMQR